MKFRISDWAEKRRELIRQLRQAFLSDSKQAYFKQTGIAVYGFPVFVDAGIVVILENAEVIILDLDTLEPIEVANSADQRLLIRHAFDQSKARCDSIKEWNIEEHY